MKKYTYFILEDPLDDHGKFLLVVNNETGLWSPTLLEATKSKIRKGRYLDSENQAVPLTYKQVKKKIKNIDLDHFKIIYYGDNYPTIESHPELFI